MSRTFRRKNYEKIDSGNRGSKIAGYFTKSELISHKPDPKRGFHKFSYEITYRAPTKREHDKDYWRLHADNHVNGWSPSRFYRQNRMNENKTINKEEINKWVKDKDYEPLTENNPRPCGWDWS
jgi:hypothetical protein